MAVPKRRDAASLSPSGENVLRCRDDSGRVRSNEQVCAFGNRNGALCVLTEGKARHPGRGSLLLDASGIGKYEGGLAEKAEKIKVSDGGEEAKI
jgi:hypothetical protein